MSLRTDDFGRAFAGSQLQIQTYVNRRQIDLNAAIASAIPELGLKGATFEWVSPVEGDKFVEYRDAAFLSRLGLTELGGELAAFWPNGGPRWDALAKVSFPGETAYGVILIEAKSYPGEMIGGGCLATEPSLTRIRASMAMAQSWLGADSGDWTGEYYQFANRLAHLYFLREICHVRTWLVNLCIFDDPHKPTRELVWRDALEYPFKALGLTNREIPFYKDVFMPALDRKLLHSSVLADRSSEIIAAGRTKEWRFLLNDRTGRHQFLGFANARGSCSLRYFDAHAGAALGSPRYGRGRNYQDAFAAELTATTPVHGPSGVSVDFIPAESLRQMRLEVGLHGDVGARESAGDSLLSGIDEFIDEFLGVQHIGSTSPHYKHRTSYKHVAQSGEPDGPALLRGIYSRIEKNWPGCPCRGGENWRLAPQLYINPENSSIEKSLEKAIAVHCPGWVNMVPVCSGVMPVLNEGGRRIDLVRQQTPGCFELFELKAGNNCDTPLYASLEIIGYGLIYLFSRRNATRLGYSPRNPILSAQRVSLIVLAPAEAYRYGSLFALECQINKGLQNLVNTADEVSMDFRFECFPAGSVWHSPDVPGPYLESRRNVYGG